MDTTIVYRQQPIAIDKDSKLYRIRVGMVGSGWSEEYYNYNDSAMKSIATVRNEIGGNYMQVKSIELLDENEWIRQRV